MKNKILPFFLLLSILAFSQSKIKVGEWKSHLPNKSCYTVTISNGKVYAGGKQTFFSYDLNTGSLRTLSKSITEFSQNSVSRMGYSNATGTLVIAYENGMIDLLNDKITPFYGIYNFEQIGSKTINHLSFFGKKVYISSDLGLVIYNLETLEVESVCRTFTNTSQSVVVWSSTVLNGELFVATDLGLFRANASDEVNKMDYRNWSLITLPNPNTPLIHFLASYNNKLFASSKVTAGKMDVLLIYQNNSWHNDATTTAFMSQQFNCQGLISLNDKLWILKPGLLVSYDKSSYKNVIGGINPFDITQFDEHNFFVADDLRGLIKVNITNGQIETITPNAPNSSLAFRMGTFDGKIAVATGGYNYEFFGGLNRGEGFSVFNKGTWQSFLPMSGKMPFVFDISSAVFNPITKKMFFGSYSNGVLEWDGSEEFKIWNHHIPGCPLKTSPDPLLSKIPLNDYNYCRVPDVAVDSKGTTWILNTPHPNEGFPSLYKYNPNGSWEGVNWTGQDMWNSYGFYTPASPEAYFQHRILIDKSDNKWLASRIYTLEPTSKIGLLVYNETKSPLPRHFRYVKDEREDICGKLVLCLAEDQEGAIWIGTDNGICYFPDQNEVFQRRAIKATIPVFENKALLKGEYVTSIAVDGNNKKWIGTKGKGLFLFNQDCTELIKYFTKENSPLTTDNINDIKVEPTSGEVFIATDEGVFSYGGDAISVGSNATSITAYPNPIKKDYNGNLILKGFTKQSILKITDIAGRLVFQTKTEGGLASWNLRDYTGSRPQAGIYLVFSAKEDGSEALVTKIAILD